MSKTLNFNYALLKALLWTLFVGYLIIVFARILSLENEFEQILNGPNDDWKQYLLYAIDIKQNGFITTSFNGPSGLLYSYFIATCLFLFGENTVPIIFAQHLLLGLSVFLCYLVFSTGLNNKKKIILLLVISAIAFIDIYKTYSLRLLSENLVVFMVSCFLYLLHKCMNFSVKVLSNKQALLFFTMTGFFMCMAALTRPNLVTTVLFLVLYFVVYKNKIRYTYSWLWLLLGIFIPLFTILSCNYVIAQSFSLFPSGSATYQENLIHSPHQSSYILRNLLSTLGFMSFTDSNYLWRPHWTLGWVLFFYVIIKLREKIKANPFNQIAMIYIISYFITIILTVNPDHGPYGFRFYFPGTIVLIPFSIQVFLQKTL